MNISTARNLKTVTILATAAGLMAFGVGAASAHVRVDPASTSEGGYSQLTFKVPNESPTAKTSRLEVTLPTGTLFTSVSVKPMDGWKATVITTELPTPVEVGGATVTKAPTSVVWTADTAHQIGQNEYQTFSISVGRLPTAGTTVILPAAQTYSDGTVVNWNEPETPGKDEPKHPVPSFVTTAASDEHSPAATVDTTAASATTPAPTAPDNTFGILGLGAGVLGLAAGATASARTRTPRKN